MAGADSEIDGWILSKVRTLGLSHQVDILDSVRGNLMASLLCCVGVVYSVQV